MCSAERALFILDQRLSQPRNSQAQDHDRRVDINFKHVAADADHPPSGD